MAKGDQLKMKCCENCTFVHPFSMRIGRRQVLGGGEWGRPDHSLVGSRSDGKGRKVRPLIHCAWVVGSGVHIAKVSI